jgi:hypothetical protein
MNDKIEVSVQELARITEDKVGVVALSDEMLAIVAGGRLPTDTQWYDSCFNVQHRICP